MRRLSRFAASATVGGLVLLCTSVVMRAQALAPVTHIASLAPGSIQGIVLDDKGMPIPGAMVSALGATPAFATTDRAGHFELRTLSPGPYLVRAHSSGFIASRGQIVDVRPSTRVSSSIALRRSATTAVLPAGIAIPSTPEAAPQPVADAAPIAGDDDHGELAWRLRHARRSILKDATLPDAVLAPSDDDPADGGIRIFEPVSFLGRAVGAPAHFATGFFGATPFTGQVNLLTTGSFDTPQQLFTFDSFSHGVAYVSLGAPVGASADWTRTSILNIANMAWFSSDRAIAEYADDIWKVPVESGLSLQSS